MHVDDAATRRLRVLLKRVARRSDAKVSAVFVPRGDDLALVVQFGIDQLALDVVRAGWRRHQSVLRAGQLVRFGLASLWPVFEGPEIAAVIYVDRTPDDFPDDRTRDDGALIAARAPRCGKPSALDACLTVGYRPETVIAELEHNRLAELFTTHRGNVTAVAHALGVCRDTAYAKARQANIDIDAFRPWRRRPHQQRA